MGLLKTMTDGDIDYLIERALVARGKGGQGGTRFSLTEKSDGKS